MIVTIHNREATGTKNLHSLFKTLEFFKTS